MIHCNTLKKSRNFFSFISLTFFLFFILSLNLNFVSAAPPFVAQETLGSDGFEIKYPELFYLKQYSYFDFNFHVFNISNGVPIDNQTVQCNFHLYNSTGDHTYVMEEVPHDLQSDHGIVNEWVARIDGNNFSSLGEYTYILQCNNSQFGGYISTGFEVTPTGNDYSLMFLIVIGLFALVLFVTALYSGNEYIMFLASLVIILLGVYTMIYGIGNVNDDFSKMVSFVIIGIGLFFIIISSLKAIAEASGEDSIGGWGKGGGDSYDYYKD